MAELTTQQQIAALSWAIRHISDAVTSLSQSVSERCDIHTRDVELELSFADKEVSRVQDSLPADILPESGHGDDTSGG